MTSPRLRRLTSDYHRLMTGFAGSDVVRIEPLGPPPAERYRVMYAVPGLRLTPDNRVVRTYQHVIQIQLPAGYPREKPYCISEGPVFHPNFGSYICIADFWSASQSLSDVIVQIGDMLQYRLFNTRSPLNAVAAKWAVENQHQLPVGNADLFPREPEVRLASVTSVPLVEATYEGAR